MFHKGLKVPKNIETWIQKEISSSHNHVCTVAHKENNVYNIYMKPKGDIDAMPLSQLGPKRKDQRIQIIHVKQVVQSQEEQEHTMIRDDAVDGVELMVLGLPRLSRTRCKTDRRTRADGTCSVQKLVSPLRSVERSSAR